MFPQSCLRALPLAFGLLLSFSLCFSRFSLSFSLCFAFSLAFPLAFALHFACGLFLNCYCYCPSPVPCFLPWLWPCFCMLVSVATPCCRNHSCVLWLSVMVRWLRASSGVASLWLIYGWYLCESTTQTGQYVCVRQTPYTGPFCCFLALCSGSKLILVFSSWSTGAFCSVQRIKKRSGIFSTFNFSQLYKGNSNPYFQRIQHGHVSIFRCEVLIHLSADRGWRERFWHVNFGRHACWESTVRSHHISDRRNLHCLASSWTSHGSRNSWVYQQGPLVSAFFCGRIMCRLDSFDRLKDNVQLTAQDIKEHTFNRTSLGLLESQGAEFGDSNMDCM